MPGGGTLKIGRTVHWRASRRASPGDYVEVAVRGAATASTRTAAADSALLHHEGARLRTGLGLPTAYGRHAERGGIAVESTVGRGTTIKSVRLPLVTGANRPSPGAAGRRAGGNETLLLVEDVNVRDWSPTS